MGRSIREGLAWTWVAAGVAQPDAGQSTLLSIMSFAFLGVLVVFATDDLGLGAHSSGC